MDQCAIPAGEAGDGLPGRSRNLDPSVDALPTSAQPGGRSAQRSAAPPPADPAQALAFLEALGKDPATTYFRTIRHGGGANSNRKGRDLKGFDPQALARDNLTQSVYVAVGNATGATSKKDIKDKTTGKVIGSQPTGCVWDPDIESCNALFNEWDDRPIAEQLLAWRDLGLPEPSIITATGGKSAHLFWLTEEPIPREQWKEIQSRLIDYCEGDKKCKNPSRVMRLPGFAYIDKKTGKPTGTLAEIVHQSGRRYKLAEILACLPEQPEPRPAAPAAAPQPTGRGIPLEDDRPALGALPPRCLAEIRAAADCIPARVGGQDTYEQDRNALCGCAAALAEIGQPEEMALELLAHKWPSREAAAQVLRSTTTRAAGSFWKIAEANGHKYWPLPSGGGEQQAADPPDPAEEEDLSAPPKGEGKKGKGKKEKNQQQQARRLRPDEVRDRLAEVLDPIRLNVRTGFVEAAGKEYSGELLDHLYLDLSTPQETWGKEVTGDAARYWAHRDQFDPVRDFLEALADPLPMEQWDQLEEHALGITDPLSGTILRRWLIAAVARVMEPGCWFRTSPVLIGGQEKGKTEWIRTLAGEEWFLSGVGKLDRDAAQRLRRAWVVELGELDGITRKADQEHLKSFLTERIDTYRAPYARSDESHPRRCVFIGSANGAPLRDPTGSTRFAVIHTGSSPLPVAWLREHRAALWARAVEQYRARVSWTHTEEERQEIAERNLGHTVMDPWHDLLEQELVPRGRLGLPVQTTDIYGWLDIAAAHQNQQTAERIGRILQALGWEKARRRHNGKPPMLAWWPCTPCTGGVHGGVHGQKPGQDSDSPAPCTPCTPIRPKDGKQEGGGEKHGQAAAAPPAAAAETQECGRFGVHGVHTPSDPSQGNGSAVHPRGARGVHGVHGPSRWRASGPVRSTEHGLRVPLVEEITGAVALPEVTADNLDYYGLSRDDLDFGEVAA